MEYSTREFRANMSNLLDDVYTGKTVIIRRGAERYAVQLIDPYGKIRKEAKAQARYESKRPDTAARINAAPNEPQYVNEDF